MLPLLSAVSTLLPSLAGGDASASGMAMSPDNVTSSAGSGAFTVGGGKSGLEGMLPWLAVIVLAVFLFRK